MPKSNIAFWMAFDILFSATSTEKVRKVKFLELYHFNEVNFQPSESKKSKFTEESQKSQTFVQSVSQKSSSEMSKGQSCK